jgi:hypothetical protein
MNHVLASTLIMIAPFIIRYSIMYIIMPCPDSTPDHEGKWQRFGNADLKKSTLVLPLNVPLIGVSIALPAFQHRAATFT